MTDEMPFSCRLDHLVVTASSLAAGVDWVAARSGVILPKGGAHPLMATHNHLSALAADQFLEVIAIDPDAPAPAHPRWFALDDQEHRKQLSVSPRLTTWVVGTDNLDQALHAASKAGIVAGEPVTLTRDDLTWRLALKPDGTLAYGGVFPILIEWPAGINPVARMQDQQIRLDKLTVSHPQHKVLSQAFRALGISSLAEVQQGAIRLSANLHVGDHPFELN